MRSIRRGIVWASCIGVVASVAWAQASRKPGLYEMTTSMTWQQSPLPAGMPGMPSGMPNMGPRTFQVCVTQQQIDKYGAYVPESRAGCQVTNVVKSDHSMSADLVCTGAQTGQGKIESSWTDDGHAKGKVHFVGVMQMGQNSRPMEWTAETNSVYKGADCGSVKPIQVPEK